MIQRHTFEFLKELAGNNNREWFQANKNRHDAARENVIEFTAGLIKLMHRIDPGIDAALDAKKCVMRIYRDIRFSKNKTPYKNNFGVSIPTRGIKAGGAEYYLHITPDQSFIAGGYWIPEAAHLKSIRQEIDYNADDLKKIVDDAGFIKLFGHFREQDRLKSVPRDFNAENDNIELLKLKSFIAQHPLTNTELSKKNAAETVAAICSRIHPLNMFLNNAIT